MDLRTRRDLSVLIGDDDVGVRDCVVEILADRGFHLYTASSGSGALRTLLSAPIDFSILDVEMPDMSGPEVIRAYLRGPWIVGLAEPPSRPWGRRSMPTIFMSGNPAEEIRDACRSVGACFLDKPFAPAVLRAAVDRLLQEHLS